MGQEADILVIFGITGDLARKMTFPSLYRLERRGALNCRILGVARNQWSQDELDLHAGESINEHIDDADPEVIERLENRLDYIRGEFDDDETYSRLAQEMASFEQAVFYLEIPPSLFAEVVRRLHK